MEIRIFENQKEIDLAAAKYFIDVLQNKQYPILGLATGSSPIGLYNNLISAYNKDKISFKNTTTFNLDEYVGLGIDDEQSYRNFMNKHLFNQIDINLENTNIPDGKLSPEESSKIYNEKLTNVSIDIQILGIGTNGHIAFNEPGTSFSSQTHIVDLKKETIDDNARFFNDKNDVPRQAITMGLANIMQAKQIILIASGEKKAKAISLMIQGAMTEDIPASILQKHPNVTILIDRKLAKKIISCEHE